MKIYAKVLGMLAIIVALSVMSRAVHAGQFSLAESDDTPVVTLTMPGQEEADDGTYSEEAPKLHLRITPPESSHESSNKSSMSQQDSSRNRSYAGQDNRRDDKPSRQTEQPSKNRKRENRSKKHERRDGHAGAYQSGPHEISGVRIVDIYSGRVMPINKVDLKPTLDRIEAGIRNPHRNDGSVFRNLSHKLPRKSRNYYREYVVPTEGIRGPGPQRLIIGGEGEIYYTYDHYDSFVKVERE